MTKHNEPTTSPTEGYGRARNDRAYRWTYDPIHGFRFRGAGISQTHQPGPRHPVWELVEQWQKENAA